MITGPGARGSSPWATAPSTAPTVTAMTVPRRTPKSGQGKYMYTLLLWIYAPFPGYAVVVFACQVSLIFEEFLNFEESFFYVNFNEFFLDLY